MEDYWYQQNCSDDPNAVPLPPELTEMFKPQECQLCGVFVESQATAYTHYEGRVHQRNVEQYMKDNYNIRGSLGGYKEKFQPVRCDVCSVTLTSNVVYQQHLNGKVHKKNLKRQIYLPPPPSFDEGLEDFDNPLDFLKSLPPPPDLPKLSSFFCEVCGVRSNTELQLQVHMNGFKHKKRVEKMKEYGIDQYEGWKWPEQPEQEEEEDPEETVYPMPTVEDPAMDKPLQFSVPTNPMPESAIYFEQDDQNLDVTYSTAPFAVLPLIKPKSHETCDNVGKEQEATNMCSENVSSNHQVDSAEEVSHPTDADHAEPSERIPNGSDGLEDLAPSTSLIPAAQSLPTGKDCAAPADTGPVSSWFLETQDHPTQVPPDCRSISVEPHSAGVGVRSTVQKCQNVPQWQHNGQRRYAGRNIFKTYDSHGHGERPRYYGGRRDQRRFHYQHKLKRSYDKKEFISRDYKRHEDRRVRERKRRSSSSSSSRSRDSSSSPSPRKTKETKKKKKRVESSQSCSSCSTCNSSSESYRRSKSPDKEPPPKPSFVPIPVSIPFPKPIQEIKVEPSSPPKKTVDKNSMLNQWVSTLMENMELARTSTTVNPRTSQQNKAKTDQAKPKTSLPRTSEAVKDRPKTRSEQNGDKPCPSHFITASGLYHCPYCNFTSLSGSSFFDHLMTDKHKLFMFLFKAKILHK